MNDPLNPYASSPTAQHHLPNAVQQAIIPAGQGARFTNLVIDYLFQFVMSFVVGIVIVLVGREEGVAFIERTPGILFGIPIMVGYYIVMEATTSRTLGKLVTGTMVVSEDGGKPTLRQIIGRTLCRLIPFEAFSFFGTPSRGLHDSLAKTFVVKTR